MKLYQALLYLCPAAFRAEYGSQMCAVFRARLRDATSSFGRFIVWLDAVFDIVLTASRTHLDILWRDLRYTARTLTRSFGFAVTVIAVAAIGIGATTAAFSITDHVLFRSLPFPEADRLVELWQDEPPYSQTEPSPPNYLDWKRMSKSFQGMASYRGLSVNMVAQGGAPERLDGASLTADLLPMMGAGPALGRLFTPEDDRSGAPGTLILSYGLWQQRFGADPSVLGQKVLLDGEPFVIIGIMRKGFYFPNRFGQLWTPMRFRTEDFADRTNTYLRVIAKLKPGVSVDHARQEMRLIGADLRREYPKENAHVSVTVLSLRNALLGRSPRILLMALFGASLCVLLIACTNLANLLLARALVRRKELAMRAAMGAGREQLVRQMLTESAVLATAGGVLGVIVAVSAMPLLGKFVPDVLPIAQNPEMDWRVLLFSLLLTIVTGIGFGVFPALRACTGVDVRGLHEGSRGGVGGRRERLRAGLVVAEVTATVVLLVSAGLLIRALLRVQETDPGFRAEGVLTMRTVLPMPKYEKTSRRVAFYSQVLTGIRELPGVTGVAYTSFLPMVVRGGIWPVIIEGQPVPESGPRPASLRVITPGFFSTMGIPLLRGRDVSDADTLNKLMFAVVSESFVRRYWPNENPVGRRFLFAESMRTVVGVVGNVRVRGLERESEPQVYLPYRQQADGNFSWYAPKDLVIRSSSNLQMLLPAIRRIVAHADPEIPVSDVQTLNELLEDQTAPRRLQVRVLSTFAIIAFVLAAVGIHGLLSFAVSSRAQEIGVRIAVGARSRDILGMIMGEGILLGMAGILVGASLAYLAAKAMQALLAGIQPGDPGTFLAAITVSLAMALAGSFLPALRAMRVDPITAIRSE